MNQLFEGIIWCSRASVLRVLRVLYVLRGDMQKGGGRGEGGRY